VWIELGYNFLGFMWVVFDESNGFSYGSAVAFEYAFDELFDLVQCDSRVFEESVDYVFCVFSLMNFMIVLVGVSGPNTSAMPIFFSAGMSSSGMTPPPSTRMSFSPFCFINSVIFGKRVMCAPDSMLRATTSTSSCNAVSTICSGVCHSPV